MAFLTLACRRFVDSRSSHQLIAQTTLRSLWSSSSSSSSSPSSSVISDLSKYPLDDPHCNVTTSIANRVGKNLHLQTNHPLHTIHKKIREFWGPQFKSFDSLSPIVSTRKNFDLLRIPPDHVSRRPSDTYYLNEETMLRTHTSAHQVDLLKRFNNHFLVTGDVYRRDEIDRSHYPVFHQMEGVKVFSRDELRNKSENDQISYIENDLKVRLEDLAADMFGAVDIRWVDAYFPFTHPSYEMEILFQDEWLEVLGCGVVHPEIMANAGRPREKGWAFGLGLERLAMVLFQIPDIRLFWTDDERFHSQFTSGDIVQFKPYSRYPSCTKDVSFWLGEKTFHVNDLNELVRDVAGDLVEEVVLVDEFTHPKTGRASHCYRINYRSMDRSLTNEEIDKLQFEVRDLLVKELGVELR